LNVLLRLVILLTAVPLVELWILFRLAEQLSWAPTIALVLLTGVLGAWLARREGLKTLGRIHADLSGGVAPTDALVDGALILVAGLVLITPGILTDAVGFALLIAPVRRFMKRRLAEAFRRHVVVSRHEGSREFIDVPATGSDVDEPPGEQQNGQTV
jgi:UPF0716 protein FxsA